MTNRIWNGSGWKEYKNLKVFSGFWKDAVKGWINTSSGWRQWYPEYPVNTAAPSISGTLVRGNVLTVSDGTWKGFPNDKAFSYTQTSYQWLRNGSSISGATGNQYTTTASDIGTNIISCRVRVTNNRGFTDSTSSTVSITGQTYTLTYNANGGIVLGNASTSTSVTEGSSVTLPAATRTGYTFNGWYTAASGGSYIGTTNNTYTPTSTVTIYAQWTAATYTVSYDANGGTGAPGSQTKTHDVTLTLSNTTPSRTGYTFSGWNTASAGGGTAYSAGGSYTANAATTLYAQWTALTYTVSYDANGGTGAPGSQTKTYGVTLTLSSTTPTRTGYTFSGWNTASAGGGTAYSAGGSYTANAAATLYAQWTANLSKPSGGSTSLSGSAVVGQTITATTSGWSPTPTSYDTRIVRGTAGVIISETTVASSTTSSVSYTIPSGDTGYYYKGFSKGINDAGTADSWASSNEIGPVTAAGGGAPAVPTGGSADIYQFCGYTSIYWNAVSGATTYEVYYNTSTTTPSANPDTSFLETGITTAYHTIYSESYNYFWVRARNSSGVSNWSSRITAGVYGGGAC
jgi:uncharacterized repeat protein (TIGR02543 family)